MLLEARDEDGEPLSDEAVRDHVLTLLFAGHDTTTATITFLLYELARNPHEQVAPLREELDSVLAGGRLPSADDLARNLPRLEMAVDETLRLYPPAWIGPRRSVEPFEFAGRQVPGGVHVNYCSWASHRIPDVFPDPDAFVPDRFAPEEKAKLPKGAYVPFGGGSRTCIGMRFGLMEVKAIAALLLQRFDFALAARLPPARPPDAHARPARRPADGGAPARVSASPHPSGAVATSRGPAVIVPALGPDRTGARCRYRTTSTSCRSRPGRHARRARRGHL